jgi:hypothetical protein
MVVDWTRDNGIAVVPASRAAGRPPLTWAMCLLKLPSGNRKKEPRIWQDPRIKLAGEGLLTADRPHVFRRFGSIPRPSVANE